MEAFAQGIQACLAEDYKALSAAFQEQSAPTASSPQESAKRPPGGVQRASSSRAMQQRRASAAQAALEAAKTRMAGGGGAAGGARRASAVPGSSPGGFAQAQSLSSSSGFGGGTMPFEKPPLVSRGSMIGASNGVASVIEDDEGQLMWVETFGRAVRVVPCDKFFEGLEVFLDQKLNDGERKLLHYVINMGQPEQMEIDVDLFSGFLKGFGPLTSSLTNVKSILGSNWFYGFLSHRCAPRSAHARARLCTDARARAARQFACSRPSRLARTSCASRSPSRARLRSRRRSSTPTASRLCCRFRSTRRPTAALRSTRARRATASLARCTS